MEKTRLKKMEAGARSVCLRALTTLPPAAAMAIECAAETSGGAAGKRLNEIYDAFIGAGINQTPVCAYTDELLLAASIGEKYCADLDAAETALLSGARRALTSLGISPVCRIVVERTFGDRCGLLARPVCLKSGSDAELFRLSGGGVPEIAELIAGSSRDKSAPCPPIIAAAGLGKTRGEAEAFAQEALTRPVDTPSPDPLCADAERRALSSLGRPGGLRPLAALVNGDVESALFCAVITGCWCTRHARAELTLD